MFAEALHKGHNKTIGLKRSIGNGFSVARDLFVKNIWW
jgi:hypothetical protein